MPSIELWAINHKKPERMTGIFGGISKQFIVGVDNPDPTIDPRYCDMAAPATIYRDRAVSGYIGFHGYRKMINFRDEFVKSGIAPGWEEVSLDRYLAYQSWLADQDGRMIAHALIDHDILTVAPFDCSYNGTMGMDYVRSRSAKDWWALTDALIKRGWLAEDFNTSLIRPMHFVAKDYVFQRWMRFWEEVMRDVVPHVHSADAVDPGYQSRSLAFLSERLWSLWCDKYFPHVRVKTYPLMMCWDAR